MSQLGPIRCVTFVSDDLAASESAWCEHLAHHRVASGQVDTAQAQGWQAPAVAGRDFVILEPAGAPGHYLRFIEGPSDPDYRPFTTTGWNAAEVLVRDVDALAERLQGSPFEIIGAPADLSFTDRIRAMQVRGPAQEILYLTEIKGEVPGFDLPQASADVEHCFVGILGGHCLEDMQSWFGHAFGIAKAPAVASRLTVLARALGLPIARQHQIAALTLAPGYLIELDEFPRVTTARPAPDGELVPAMAMVSFDWQGEDKAAPGQSYESTIGPVMARGCCEIGLQGERIEILYQEFQDD